MIAVLGLEHEIEVDKDANFPPSYFKLTTMSLSTVSDSLSDTDDIWVGYESYMKSAKLRQYMPMSYQALPPNSAAVIRSDGLFT